MADVDVVVVGAGVAGLAAAARLRAARRSVLLIEAGDRIGGRAHTTLLGGTAFDHGASWLHAADRNPLARLAERNGDTLIDADAAGNERVFVDGRPASDADGAARQAAEARFTSRLEARAQGGGPDVSLAKAVTEAGLREDPWTATVEAWEAPIIAAADADDLSLADWARNALSGANLSVGGGLGAWVCRRLGPPAGPVQLACAARRIRWSARGVAVETAAGLISASCVILTPSTGVLRAGTIGFDPTLPDPILAALNDLPMGLLSKVAIRTHGPDRLGLPSSCRIEARLEAPDRPFMVVQAWPRGADHLIGFIGGRHAWSLEEAGPEAAAAALRDHLGGLLGGSVRASLAGEVIATRWGADPLFGGAYAYARPGATAARASLATPIGSDAVILAGEACDTDGLAGTVAGAYRSGERAADRACARLGRMAG